MVTCFLLPQWQRLSLSLSFPRYQRKNSRVSPIYSTTEWSGGLLFWENRLFDKCPAELLNFWNNCHSEQKGIFFTYCLFLSCSENVCPPPHHIYAPMISNWKQDFINFCNFLKERKNCTYTCRHLGSETFLNVMPSYHKSLGPLSDKGIKQNIFSSNMLITTISFSFTICVLIAFLSRKAFNSTVTSQMQIGQLWFMVRYTVCLQWAFQC